MASEKQEYDAALGGTVQLPDGIPTYKFASERLKEMKSLLHAIQNPTVTKLIFQTLPKHMRRRAMSHHPKRLPRKYREGHKSQQRKAGLPQKAKRPSRKYRRKPSNLLKEYIRRQQKYTWLETHIWHAKRFHMVQKWGYKLPYSSCDKTYRACYRATAMHCLLQDISYYGCIQITGELELIRDGFAHLSSPKCGLGICARTWTSGKREGEIDLFRNNKYPEEALAKVSFIWKPVRSLLEITRTLWIFIHPAAYEEVLIELVKTFNLQSTKNAKIPIEDDATDVENPVKSGKKHLTQKFMTKSFAYTRVPKFNNTETGLCLTELKDTMNRFRLTGPLSQAVLTNAMKCKKFLIENSKNWFGEWCSEDEENIRIHEKQSEFWYQSKSIFSPDELTPNMILGLNIEDPRVNRPQKRDKALPDTSVPIEMISNLKKFLNEYPYSSIWDFDLRNKISEQMISTHEFCKKRQQEAFVPGASCPFEQTLQPVPVLLIQRPGSQNERYKRLGFGCGWDVIVPSGYGLSLWLSMIMWGARPGALKEMLSLKREQGEDLFLPDTISGRKDAADKFLEFQTKYFRLPPNKRCNYKKLAIASPFRCPFLQLVREWSNDSSADGFSVLRESDTLMKISKALHKNCPLPEISQKFLIPIYLTMTTRGNPGDFAIICIPTTFDLKKDMKNKRKLNKSPVFTEKIHVDDTESIRKKLRIKHKKLLKRLRGRRVRAKRKLQETSEKRVKIQPAGTSQLVIEQWKKMCELWLPSQPNSIRNQCSREVFGYVTQSDFSFTESKCTAIGYVTIGGIRKFLEVCKGYEKKFLVRSTNSYHYRFANFKCCYRYNDEIRDCVKNHLHHNLFQKENQPLHAIPPEQQKAGVRNSLIS